MNGEEEALLLEDVLDVLSGLLQLGSGLVALTFCNLLVVAGCLAEGFFRLAAKVFSTVLDLVVCAHDGTFLFVPIRRLPVGIQTRGGPKFCLGRVIAQPGPLI